MRDEMKEPKNIIGVVLVVVGFLLAMWESANNRLEPYWIYIAGALYITGMILIVFVRGSKK